ncbi:MAG: DUF2505 domain-containing protein [Labilithrix sp.]|nr:DUF2505 domain-containing protein [Labilithrix sp.]MBX3224201.1 DUF2505 domain-containing protein [Labilithrix sp.]
MATFTMRHDLDCTPERFWELFFDNELQKRIFADLGFPKWEVVEMKETEAEVVRIVRAIPKLDAPGPVAKLLGSGFGYTEEGRFDRATKVYRFAIKPSTLADKLKNEGSVKVEPAGDGKCTRIVEIVAEAKIFGVGGMIEKMTEKSHRDGWEKSARVFNDEAKKSAAG